MDKENEVSTTNALPIQISRASKATKMKTPKKTLAAKVSEVGSTTKRYNYSPADSMKMMEILVDIVGAGGGADACTFKPKEWQAAAALYSKYDSQFFASSDGTFNQTSAITSLKAHLGLQKQLCNVHVLEAIVRYGLR